jgi:hypothetical protein
MAISLRQLVRASSALLESSLHRIDVGFALISTVLDAHAPPVRAGRDPDAVLRREYA